MLERLEYTIAWLMLNRVLLYNPTVMLLSIYPADLKTLCLQKSESNVFSSFIHNCWKLEVNKVLFNHKVYIETAMSI